MKYGPIICDPTSEEAKKLVGKKVIYGWSCASLKKYPEEYIQRTLKYIQDSCRPFVCGDESYYFIREVIEEKPKYRPYTNKDEMVADYCERFGFVKTDFAMPLIWVKNDKDTSLVTAFSSDQVEVFRVFWTLEEIFNNFTYLDGSPVGKEFKE